MKATAIIGLIFAVLSIFIPVIGVFLALLCSVLALISFRSHPTLSGISFGINIINTAILSPSIVLTDNAISSGPISASPIGTESGDIYWFYVGFHLVLLVIAILYKILRKSLSS